MQITRKAPTAPYPEPGKCIYCMKPLADFPVFELCDCPGFNASLEEEMLRLESLWDEDQKCSPDAD